MKLFIYITLFVVSFHFSGGSLSCKCDKAKCNKPRGCNAGIRPDMCNCCFICAKQEGELCGGIEHVEGECGDGLQCIVRHIRNRRNRMKQNINELVGRCENVKCHLTWCPFGQSCVNTSGKPTCICTQCKDMETYPVCGETNNKNYKNECELRKDECLKGRPIGMKNGPCIDKSASKITCFEDSMKIEILKTYLDKATRGKPISLIDPRCNFEQNETHIYYTTKLNECSTRITYTLTSITYSNIVRTVTNPNSIIIRHKSMQVPFECDYSLRSRNRIKISSKGHFGNGVEETLRGNGDGVKIKFNTTKIKRSVDTNIKVDINRVETYLVELKSKALANIKAQLLPRFCYATTVYKKQRWMRYTLIEKGCSVENAVEILNSTSSIIRLSIPGIKFRGAKYPGILVRCKIRACFPRNPSDTTLCATSCPLKRKRRTTFEKDILFDLEVSGKPIIVH